MINTVFFSFFIRVKACVSESLQTEDKQVRVQVWSQSLCVMLVFAQRKEFQKKTGARPEHQQKETKSSPPLTCLFFPHFAHSLLLKIFMVVKLVSSSSLLIYKNVPSLLTFAARPSLL